MIFNKKQIFNKSFRIVSFQVEYRQELNRETPLMTPRINRHRLSVEIEVVPCTKYNFRVIASEDWKGMREDFKVFSEGVGFKVEYTPKFINPPMVKERGRRYNHFLCFVLEATELQIFKDHCQGKRP